MTTAEYQAELEKRGWKQGHFGFIRVGNAIFTPPGHLNLQERLDYVAIELQRHPRQQRKAKQRFKRFTMNQSS